MNVWFPEFYTEAHRTPDRQNTLVRELEAIGVNCQRNPTAHTNLAFCGSIFRAAQVRGAKMPIIHYNWDLYPWMVEQNERTGFNWKIYINDLASCAVVLVPSRQTAERTQQFAQRSATVVLAPVAIWDVPQQPARKYFPTRSYMLDVMRDYVWDRYNNLTLEACRKAKVNLIRTRTSYPWDDFRWLVANARCLLSVLDEASTGGMTLLEGYAHGVPCVVSNSPMNGVVDYFGERATYFDYNNPDSLVELLKGDIKPAPADCREWVASMHSDKVFAAKLKVEFEKCLSKT